MTQTVEEFVREFDDLADSFGEDFSEPLERCKELIAANVEENFRQSQTAGGTGWPVRQAPRRRGDGAGPADSLLVLSGALLLAASLGNVQRIVDGNELLWGVSKDTIPYAAVHQFGWPEQNIPAREYLAISAVTVDQCAELVLEAKHAELA